MATLGKKFFSENVTKRVPFPSYRVNRNKTEVTTMDDSEIVALYFARNPAAVQETETAYGARLNHLALGILGSREDAEESVNDTYLAAWRTIPPQRPCLLFPYLAKICRNSAFGKLDWQNAKKRKAEVVALTQEMEQCVPDSRAMQPMEQAELGHILNRFLKELPQENRLIFLRRYWFADTIGGIARRFELSESSVKVRLHRIRNKLRAYLEQEGITV